MKEIQQQNKTAIVEHCFSLVDGNNFDITTVLEEAHMDALDEQKRKEWGPYSLYIDAVETHGATKIYHFRATYIDNKEKAKHYKTLGVGPSKMWNEIEEVLNMRPPFEGDEGVFVQNVVEEEEEVFRQEPNDELLNAECVEEYEEELKELDEIMAEFQY